MEGLCPGCGMREWLRAFWQLNYFPLYAAYGQAWFVLAMIALLNSRRRSQLPLARSIWLLGLYGIVHAFREWGFVFIPIQATYLPPQAVSLMEWAHMAILPVSFLFLLAFTVHLAVHLGMAPRWLWILPGLIMAGWSLLILLMYGMWKWPTAPIFRYSDIMARYAMAFPSGVALAALLWYHASLLPPWASRKNVRWMRSLSVVFLIFAVVDGLIVPRAEFFPANVLNYTVLLHATGLPIPVYRILVALSMALSTWATVRLFEEDVQQRIFSLEQERVLLEDRERISRELHDHTIQALYALGLEIERASTLLFREPLQARGILARAMERLNEIISETRVFVYDLRNNDTIPFPQLVEQAIAAVSARDFLKVHINMDEALYAWRCSPECAHHLVALLEEALSNVIKHAHAQSVEIIAADEEDSVVLCVCDDGCGFDTRTVQRGMGLHHMKERAHMLGGVLSIRSKPGEGTKVRLIVPRTVEVVHGQGADKAVAYSHRG